MQSDNNPAEGDTNDTGERGGYAGAMSWRRNGILSTRRALALQRSREFDHSHRSEDGIYEQRHRQKFSSNCFYFLSEMAIGSKVFSRG